MWWGNVRVLGGGGGGGAGVFETVCLLTLFLSHLLSAKLYNIYNPHIYT